MSRNLPKLFFSRLRDAAPPSGHIQFYDGYFPSLTPNLYSIQLTHTLAAPSGDNPTYTANQQFNILAPEFTIDTDVVQSIFPPNGASAIYDQKVPTVVLTDPSLPWERSLVPGSDVPDLKHPTPWMALVIFAEGEILLPAGSNNPATTTTVKDLLATDPDVLKPDLPAGWVSDQMLASQCQTITIPGAVFQAAMPLTTDLPYLAHCRAVNAETEDAVLLSVLFANRLPLASGGVPLRYYAHVVSLEGFGGYLGPNGTPIPNKQGQNVPMDVEMVSLYNWTFVSMPQKGLSFEAVIEGLIDSQTATPVLSLPVSGALPESIVFPQKVRERLNDGYAPLTSVTSSGDQTFAWYRGPLSAVVPQPVPPVGQSGVPVSQADSADELMIYLEEEGVFDLSYAAAWDIGRALALADANFAEQLTRLRNGTRDAVARIARRLEHPRFAAEPSTLRLLDRDVVRQHFAGQIGAGLGRQWTGALRRTRDGAPAALAVRAPRHRANRVRVHPRQVFDRPDLGAALASHLDELLDPVSDWLAKLAHLEPLPFSHLVPHPLMLPVESIRFFYVDPWWIQAATAGALSLVAHTSADASAIAALRPEIHSQVAAKRQAAFRRRFAGGVSAPGNNGITMTGVLIRSQLISGWPTLAVSASAAGKPVDIVRDSVLSDNVRMLLFDGVPDTVSLAEPYQGLQFGVEDNGIAPRNVTDANNVGAQLNVPPVPPSGGYKQLLTDYTRQQAQGMTAGGVLTVATLATALAKATGATQPGQFGAGDFALQMVRTPELQAFTHPPVARTAE